MTQAILNLVKEAESTLEVVRREARECLTGKTQDKRALADITEAAHATTRALNTILTEYPGLS